MGSILMSWTEERVEQLKRLWAEGLSASQIAAALGGVTRNAVIGKVHRLSLSGRAKPAAGAAPGLGRNARPSAGAPRRIARPLTAGNTALKAEYRPMREPAPAPMRELEPPVSQHATILSLNERMCKWPIGDPGREDFHFCGNQSREGQPYCEYHARIAYQPVNDRRRERRLSEVAG
jgi:GcrA cell cycle regulator